MLARHLLHESSARRLVLPVAILLPRPHLQLWIEVFQSLSERPFKLAQQPGPAQLQHLLLRHPRPLLYVFDLQYSPNILQKLSLVLLLRPVARWLPRAALRWPLATELWHHSCQKRPHCAAMLAQQPCSSSINQLLPRERSSPLVQGGRRDLSSDRLEEGTSVLWLLPIAMWHRLPAVVGPELAAGPRVQALLQEGEDGEAMPLQRPRSSCLVHVTGAELLPV
mmetsp:Transcript_2348/g.8356  ORF Transcript_2348/g.8356 Transcript_2348/m.8356 type:complete len:223 (-) Transcript_2348:166-834(-)